MRSKGKKSVRNNPVTAKAREGEGGGDAPGTWSTRCRNRDFSAARGEDYGEGSTSLKPIKRTTLEQILTLQPIEDPTPEQGGYFQKGLPPTESPRWSRFSLQELLPMEDPCWSSFSLKCCRPRRIPILEQGKSMSRKKRQRGAVVDRLLFTIPPAPLMGEKIEELALKGRC